MKILISADMEGITGVVNWNQVDPSHPEYGRFRRLMVSDVNAAIRGAFAGGAASVVVIDGHGDGGNLPIEDLDPRAVLISGSPAPLSMVEGIQEGADGVMLIGYHARAGTPQAILDHTWSDVVTGLWLNSRAMGEAGLNGAVCGHFGTPVVMASGDQSLCAEVRELFGESLETAQVKRAVGRFAGECLPPEITSALLEERARLAVCRLKEQRAPQALNIPAPIRMEIGFRGTEMAELATLLPGAVRLGGCRVSYTANDMPSIYHAFIAMAGLAGPS